MIQSMTGFANAEAEFEGIRIGWELRSVNHRFLDMALRLPEDLKSLDGPCRERISGSLSRGKVDSTLRLKQLHAGPTGGSINTDALGRLLKLNAEIKQRASDAAPLSVADILRWPGVIEESAVDPAGLKTAVLACLDEAVAGLVDARRREGARISTLLSDRCGQIKQLLQALKPNLGVAEERYRNALQVRLDKLDVSADPQRLEQELALLAQRLDVAEELDRLEGHVAELAAVLERDDPVGRRLDFLIQELNREANTLASKSADENLTRTAVDLKVLVEQLREQVQNVE